MPLDELPRGPDDDLRPKRADVQIVEDDDVQAAADRLRVRLDIVAVSGAAVVPRSDPAGRRNIDERERADFLRLAVFEQLEVVLVEIGDEVPALVGHDRVDVDEIDFDLKRDRRWSICLLRLLGSPQDVVSGFSRTQGDSQQKNSPEANAASHVAAPQKNLSLQTP